MKQRTKVIFRRIAGEVTAIFPELQNGEFLVSYAVIGQHGDCDPEWIEDGEKPTMSQCSRLIVELIGLGYSLHYVETHK